MYDTPASRIADRFFFSSLIVVVFLVWVGVGSRLRMPSPSFAEQKQNSVFAIIFYQTNVYALVILTAFDF